MKWFSWSGSMPPPGKFVKLDSVKCHFLRSLDRNWVTGKVFKALYKKCSRKNIHVYGFKRRATAVLSWLDCSSTTARHWAGAPNGNFRENICSEDDLRSRIFGAFVVEFLACLPLLEFSNVYKMVKLPIFNGFDPKKGHLEFSEAFSWLKFSRR